MNDVQIFKNSQFGEIRVAEIDGKTYFVALDVCRALGYEKPRNAVAQHVDNEDALKQGLPDSQGLIQQTTLINESGVYSLVFGSKLESAKQFKKWVTSEVLPSIRKHGGYLTAEKIEEVLLNPDTIIKLATSLKQERAEKERYRMQSEEQAQRLIESAPKVEYFDGVLQSDSLIATNVIAKDLGMSAVSLNKILHQRGIIYNSAGTWVLYAKYQNKGYTGTKTTVYKDSLGNERTAVHTYWTEKGRHFLFSIVLGLPKKSNISANKMIF